VQLIVRLCHLGCLLTDHVALTFCVFKPL